MPETPNQTHQPENNEVGLALEQISGMHQMLNILSEYVMNIDERISRLEGAYGINLPVASAYDDPAMQHTLTPS